MRKHSVILKAFQTTDVLLHSYAFLCRHRFNPRYFTRKRKLGFVDTILFLLSGAKNSLQAELNRYLDMKKMHHETYSKQAFSKGRQRIRPEAFKELSDAITYELYATFPTRTFRGYHLLAVDGSRLNLPANSELKALFGEQITGGTPQPQALSSCLYDVLNGMIVDARLGGCRSSERDQAADMIQALDAKTVKNPLYIMDRGYPAATLLEAIEDLGQHYLLRCDKSFLKSVKRFGNDVIVEHKFSHISKALRFRVITISLESGENEYLVTNVFDEDLGIDDFAALYRCRWGIESRFDDLKGKMQIENFTGTTPIAVCQDFFATLYLANLAGIMALDCRDEIEAAHNTPENRYTYRLNVNLTIAALRQSVVEMLMLSTNKRRSRMLEYIGNRLMSAVVPVRNGRSNPRKVSHTLNKHPQNRKLP